jgi:hypothetical protein
MLMDHRYAETAGVGGIPEGDMGLLHHYFTLIRDNDACGNSHQGGFAGAILTQEGMELTRA